MFRNLSLPLARLSHHPPELGMVIDTSIVHFVYLHLCVVLYKSNVLEIHLSSREDDESKGQSRQEVTVLRVYLLAEPGKRSRFAQIVGLSPLLICLLVEDGTILLLDLSIYLTRANDGNDKMYSFDTTKNCIHKNEDVDVLIVPLEETKRHLQTLIDRPENSLCGAPCSLSLCTLNAIYPSVLLIPHSDGSLYYIPITFMQSLDYGQPRADTSMYPSKVLMGRYWHIQEGSDVNDRKRNSRKGHSEAEARQPASSSRISANVFDIRGLALCSMALQFSPETNIPLIEVSLIQHKRCTGTKKGCDRMDNGAQVHSTTMTLNQDDQEEEEEEKDEENEEESVWRDALIESPRSRTHTDILPSVAVQFCSLMDEQIDVSASQVPLFPSGSAPADDPLVLQGMRFVYMDNRIVPHLVRHSQCVQGKGGRVQSPHPAFKYSKSTTTSKGAANGENDGTAIALLSTVEDVLRVYISQPVNGCSDFSVLEISLRGLVDAMSDEGRKIRVVQAGLLSSRHCVYALTQVSNDTNSTSEQQATSILVCSSSLQILQCISVGGLVLFSGVSHSIAKEENENYDGGVYYLVTHDGLVLVPASSSCTSRPIKASNVTTTANKASGNGALQVPVGLDASLEHSMQIFSSQPGLETLQDLFVELCEYQQKVTPDLSIIAPIVYILNKEDDAEEEGSGKEEKAMQSLEESCEQLNAVMDHYVCLIDACTEDPSMIVERDEQFHRVCMLLVDAATGPLMAANTSDEKSNMLLLLDLCRDAHHTAATAYFTWKVTYSPVSILLSCDKYHMVQQSFHTHLVSLRRYREVQEEKEEGGRALSRWVLRLIKMHLERCDSVDSTREGGVDHGVQVSRVRAMSAMLLELCLFWAELAVLVDELQSFFMHQTNITLQVGEALKDRGEGKKETGGSRVSKREQRCRLAIKEALMQLPQNIGDELGLSGEFLFALFA